MSAINPAEVSAEKVGDLDRDQRRVIRVRDVAVLFVDGVGDQGGSGKIGLLQLKMQLFSDGTGRGGAFNDAAVGQPAYGGVVLQPGCSPAPGYEAADGLASCATA